jgi:hypothetical protein
MFMRVSFDLDDTIFVSPEKFKTERALPFPFNRLYRERLRLGTIALFQAIRAQGVELWIYTTSFRSERHIRNHFRLYGLKIDGIVNGHRHAAQVQGSKRDIMPSKCPNYYHIDLHVDDDLSVAQNGRSNGFRVFLVGAQDDDWDKKILAEMARIRALLSADS